MMLTLQHRIKISPAVHSFHCESRQSFWGQNDSEQNEIPQDSLSVSSLTPFLLLSAAVYQELPFLHNHMQLNLKILYEKSKYIVL